MMRRLHTIPRPVGNEALHVRTSKEAAVQLARLEFKISRLEREIDTATARAESSEIELQRSLRQRTRLLSVIDGAPAGNRR